MKRRVHVLPTTKRSQIALNLPRLNETRPDTRQDSRGRFGRDSNAKAARNSEMLRTDGRTDRPIQRGVESRVRDKKVCQT